MAATFKAIATVTVGSGGSSSISFSSIPATYNDLCVLLSVRTTGDQASVNYCQLRMTYNGSSSSYSYRLQYGIAAVGNGTLSSNSTTEVTWAGAVNDSTSTSNTFASNMIYIQEYASSNYKSASHDGTSESNDSSVLNTLTASLWSNTSTITSITFTPETGNFAQYSTATLYGIKNS